MAGSLTIVSRLTPAHDRLLDIIAEHLVEEYFQEIETGQTEADEQKNMCEGHV